MKRIAIWQGYDRVLQKRLTFGLRITRGEIPISAMNAGILGYVLSPETNANEEGFVLSRKVYERFQMAGLSPEQIDATLVRAHNKK